MMRGAVSRRKTARVSLLVFAAVFVSALFFQITWLSEISAQAKENAALTDRVTKLRADVDNATLSLCNYQDIENIRERAEALDMQMPDASQIRVIAVAGVGGTNTSEQAALPGGTNAQ